MKIFLTGASGFIGSKLVPRLLARLGPEDTLYMLSRKTMVEQDRRVVPLVGSLEHIEKFAQELLASDYVYHCAALATFETRADYDIVNFVPVVKMVDIVKGGRLLKNFIFISTIGAVDRHRSDRCEMPIGFNSLPNPRSAYGRSKLKAEEYIRQCGIPYCIVRPTWVYGSNMRSNSHINVFVSMVFQKSPVRQFDFPGKVSVIHIDDLCKALANALGNGAIISRTYFAETESISIGRIFSTIRSAVEGPNVKQYPLPVPLVRPFLQSFHHRFPLTMANLFIDYLYARDERFAADFGLQECVPFSTGIGDVIAANAHVAGWWVITGANSGIGLQLAAILDNAGKKLVLIDRQTDVLEQRFARHRVLRMDLSDEQQVRSGVETLRGLRVFRLVNNAGVGFRGTLMQLPFESVRAMIDVNIRAPLLLTKLLWEDLSATGGTVVNITSSVAYGPLPFMSIYAASKAFMLHWSEALRYEARPSVRVVTVTPSGTRTNFQRSAGVHDGGSGLLDPEMVARKILAAVDAGKPVKIVNPATRVMHLLARLVPRSIMTELWGRMFERYR